MAEQILLPCVGQGVAPRRTHVCSWTLAGTSHDPGLDWQYAPGPRWNTPRPPCCRPLLAQNSLGRKTLSLPERESPGERPDSLSPPRNLTPKLATRRPPKAAHWFPGRASATATLEEMRTCSSLPTGTARHPSAALWAQIPSSDHGGEGGRDSLVQRISYVRS